MEKEPMPLFFCAETPTYKWRIQITKDFGVSTTENLSLWKRMMFFLILGWKTKRIEER